MAFSYGFYNSYNHDRKYNAIQVSQIFDGIIMDGVYSSIGNQMTVRASSTNNQVIVGSGRAWFDHTWNYNDADLPVEASVSDILLDRIDAVVLDINSNNNVRENKILWITGTAASNPKKPTMIKEKDHKQYPLAYVTRKANASQITQANIENRVGTSECPFVTGILQQVSIDNLLLQWNDQWHEKLTSLEQSFENWFDGTQTSFNDWLNEMKEVAGEDPTTAMLMHMVDKNNPHQVTGDQVGPVSKFSTKRVTATTLGELKTALANFASENLTNNNNTFISSLTFPFSTGFIAVWNAGDDSATLPTNSLFTFTLIGNNQNGSYLTYLISSINTGWQLYTVSRTNNNWSKITKVIIDTDFASASVGSAAKLTTPRSLKVALNSTNAVTFDGSANQDSIPISGKLGIGNGGTNATTQADALTNLGAQPVNIRYTNYSAGTGIWAANTEYSGYSFRGTIPAQAVSEDMFPIIVFNPEQANSGNFAPIAKAGSACMYIYAKTKPTAAFIIPSILVMKK